MRSINKIQEVTRMKTLRKRNDFHWEERENIRKFAKEHLDFLLEGDYDGLKRRVERFTYRDGGLWSQEVWEALLKEAIAIGEVNHLYFLCEQMYTVSLLNSFDMETFRNVDVPVVEEWHETELEDTESPFVSSNDEQLKILMEFNWDRSPQRIIWEDGEKLYFIDATPLAAALATGKIELFEEFLKKDGWRGFYSDDEELEGFFCGVTEKKKDKLTTVFFDEVMSSLTCRIASPEEAALLSGRLDVIRKVFENQKVEELMERLSSRTIERNGQFYYREEYGMHLPDAIYWLNEEESLYIDRTYPMLHQYYELDKIIESANYVLLASYLNKHENMKNTIVEDLITRIKQQNIPKLTFDMLEEMAKLSGRHCVPISRKWLEQRKEFCVETLEAYLLGRRAFVIKKDDTVKSHLYQKHTGLNEEPRWNLYEQADEEEYPAEWDDPEDCSWDDSGYDESWPEYDEEDEECDPYEEGAFKNAFGETCSQFSYAEPDMTEEELEDVEEDGWMECFSETK